MECTTESKLPAAAIESSSSSSTGIHLTWRDLWVTVPDKAAAVQRRPILRGLTGYVRPAQVLAVMGPSGSGKSTLLDALAGRLDSSAIQVGDILINGTEQALAFGTCAYVTQDEALVTTLTVREAVYYSALVQLPDSMSKGEKKERAEDTIREMGLSKAMETRIGGRNVKGLSGGEKRRVSICIEILRRPKLLFLDEPTSGLDSAASYHVIKRISTLAQHETISVIASIHQPSTEVFKLFHNLCLLSSGHALYFGSTLGANEFFASNGFSCPPMTNPSDHYLRTINEDFDLDVEEGFGENKTSAAEAVDLLIKVFDSSDASRQVQLCVDEICQQSDGSICMAKKGSQSGFVNQCVFLTRRSSINMFRDIGYYRFRFVMHIGLCLCLGTVYRDIGFTYSSIQARGSVLFFVSSFMTFMAIGGFPSFMEDMKVFRSERLNGHYSVAAFAIANTLSSIPYLFVVSLPTGAIAYYLIGLQKSVDHFAYFSLLLFGCMMLVESMMMVVAAAVPDFLTGLIIGIGIQGIMILNSGFFRLPNDIPKPFWKIPMYYISVHNYANQGFYKNEFEGLSLDDGQSGQISGVDVLRRVWQMDMSRSKWKDLGVVFGMLGFYRALFCGIVMSVEKFKPLIRAFSARSAQQRAVVEDTTN